MTIKNNIGSGYIIFIASLAIIFFIFFVIFHIVEDNAKDKNIASSMGCESLGSARDIPQIVFFDCDGEIRMYRSTKLKPK